MQKIRKVKENLVILETTIDDVNPEIISYISDKLMNEKALDVNIFPCFMKKGRIGFLVRVLTDNPEKIAEVLIEETGTLGVREIIVEGRYKIDREIKDKKILINGVEETVRIKTGLLEKPEFEDIKALALKYNKPYREILDIIKKQNRKRNRKTKI